MNGDWNNKEILINNVMVIIIMGAFLPPTLRLFDIGYLMKLWKQRKLKKQFKNMKKEDINISQREANEIFEGPTFRMDNYFADLGKTSLLTFFFVPIIPYAVIISICGIIYSYWVDKVILTF
jgi:hypothetical protein